MADNGLLKIKKHWEQMAASPVALNELRPTARDPYLQEVVETAIERHLRPDVKLLDLGCGDGLSTLRFAATTGHALGVDYVAAFVKKAQDAARKLNRQNVLFAQADVLNLEPLRKEHGLFDIVTSIRCLINLPDWKRQAAAIQQIAQTVRPGGLFITSEGWQEGFDGLNLCRQRVQLPMMQVAKYNCLMTRLNFEAEVGKSFDLIEIISLGLYLFISRVIQPLFTRPEPPSHTHHLNKIAAELVNAGGHGTVMEYCDYSGVYVLRRRTEG